MSVIVVATLWPVPERRAEVLDILREAIPEVHAEDGCELYALNENDDRLVYVEQWASAAALDVHSKGAALAKVNPKLQGLLSRATDVQVLRPVPAGDPVKGVVRA
jgi:quinol monooxygenase YgiN